MLLFFSKSVLGYGSDLGTKVVARRPFPDPYWYGFVPGERRYGGALGLALVALLRGGRTTLDESGALHVHRLLQETFLPRIQLEVRNLPIPVVIRVRHNSRDPIVARNGTAAQKFVALFQVKFY